MCSYKDTITQLHTDVHIDNLLAAMDVFLFH